MHVSHKYIEEDPVTSSFSSCSQQDGCSESPPSPCEGVDDCLEVKHSNKTTNTAPPKGIGFYGRCIDQPVRPGEKSAPRDWTCTTMCDQKCFPGAGALHSTFLATGDMRKIASASSCSSYGDMTVQKAMFPYPFSKENEQNWIHCNTPTSCDDGLQWPVNCSYDVSDIWGDKTGATLKAVKDNISDFGFDSGDKGYKQFTDKYPDQMEKLCMTKQTQIECNPSWDTGTPMSACAGVNAGGDLGSVCRAWWGALDPKPRDNYMTGYCNPKTEIDNPECQCVSPSPTLYPDYYDLVNNGIYKGNRGCWWKACIAGTGATYKAFIPSTVTANNCPDVCEAIVRVADGSSISNSTFSQHVNCNFGSKNNGDGNDSGDGGGKLDKKQKELLLIIAAAAVIVVLLLAAAAY